MQILKDENGNIIQTAAVGEIPNGIEIDFSMYKMDESGNLMLDTEKMQVQQKAVRKSEILERLEELDRISNRPIRAILVAESKGEDIPTEDISRLETIENEAKSLREELNQLEENK